MSVGTGARSRRIGYALVATAATGWGLWPLVLARAPMPAELSSAIVMAVLSLAGLPLMLRDRVARRAKLADWAAVAWLGVADSANVGLFFAAYQRTTVAIAVLTHYLTPIFVALVAPLALREPIGRRTSFGVAVSFTGLVLLLSPWRDGLSSNDALGAALGAGSAVFYASNVIVNKRLTDVFSGSELMFFHGFVAVPLLWSFVPRGALAATPVASLAVIVTASLLNGALCGLLFVWGLRRVDASHASILTLLEPFIAVIVAAVFMKQPIGVASVVGGALILAGSVVVVSQPRLK